MVYYSSRANHIQTHWGRRTWDALFLLAADFPHARACDDDVPLSERDVAKKRSAWEALFRTLPDVLSCPVCGEHFRDFMARKGGAPFRAALRNREALFRWLHECKADVNRRTRRKNAALASVRRRYIAPCDRGGGRRRRGSRSR